MNSVVHCNNSLHACGNRRTFHLQQIVPIWDTNHAERQHGKIIVQLDWFHGLIFNVFRQALVVGRRKTGQKARQDCVFRVWIKPAEAKNICWALASKYADCSRRVKVFPKIVQCMS